MRNRIWLHFTRTLFSSFHDPSEFHKVCGYFIKLWRSLWSSLTTKPPTPDHQNPHFTVDWLHTILNCQSSSDPKPLVLANIHRITESCSSYSDHILSLVLPLFTEVHAVNRRWGRAKKNHVATLCKWQQTVVTDGWMEKPVRWASGLSRRPSDGNFSSKHHSKKKCILKEVLWDGKKLWKALQERRQCEGQQGTVQATQGHRWIWGFQSTVVPLEWNVCLCNNLCLRRKIIIEISVRIWMFLHFHWKKNKKTNK